MPPPLSLLLLSDIHFGSLAISNEFIPNGTSIRGSLSGAVPMCESLVKMVKGEDIYAVLVAGDLTSSASPIEFTGCLDRIHGISEQLNVANDHIIYTFGNHDTNWHISKIPDRSDDVEKELYLKVAASVGETVLPINNSVIRGPVPGSGVFETEHINVYIVNSAYYSSHDQTYRHGKLGDDQCQWLGQQFSTGVSPAKWNVLLLHHHPFPYKYPTPAEDISHIEEGAELMQLIGYSGIDIVCHGHRHHPIVFTDNRSGWKKPVTFLCAGSLSVNEEHRRHGEPSRVRARLGTI